MNLLYYLCWSEHIALISYKPIDTTKGFHNTQLMDVSSYILNEKLYSNYKASCSHNSFLKKFLEDISYFCGATDTPVLDFLWRLPWVSKPVIIF